MDGLLSNRQSSYYNSIEFFLISTSKGAVIIIIKLFIYRLPSLGTPCPAHPTIKTHPLKAFFSGGLTHSLTYALFYMPVGTQRMIGQPLIPIPLCFQTFEGLHPTLNLSKLSYHLVFCLSFLFPPFSSGQATSNIHFSPLKFLSLVLPPDPE